MKLIYLWLVFIPGEPEIYGYFEDRQTCEFHLEKFMEQYGVDGFCEWGDDKSPE